MTALSTTSPGVKPPTTILSNTIGYHDTLIRQFKYICGGHEVNCVNSGAPTTMLNVTGSGYIQFLFAGNQAGQTNPIALDLSIDGSLLVSSSVANGSVTGPIVAGGTYANGSASRLSCVLDAYRFDTGFSVDVTCTSAICWLIYKYYLD